MPFEESWKRGGVVRARGLLDWSCEKDGGDVEWEEQGEGEGEGERGRVWKDEELFGDGIGIGLEEDERRVVRGLMEGFSVMYGGRDGERIVEDVVKRVCWSGGGRKCGVVVWAVDSERVRGCWRRLKRWGVERCCCVEKDGIVGDLMKNGEGGSVSVVVVDVEVLRTRVFGLGAPIDDWRSPDMLDGVLTSDSLACVVVDDTFECSIEAKGISGGGVWEDLLMGMPSRFLMLVLVPRLESSLLSANGTLPLWFQSVQNVVLPIAPAQESSLKVDTVIHHPRTHRHPRRVDLMDDRGENGSEELDWALDVCTLSFASPSEAQYADVLSLLLGRPEMDKVLPATVFIMGQEECEIVAEGVFNGLQQRIDSTYRKYEQQLQKRIEEFAEAHADDLSEKSISLLGLLCYGVGFLHESLAPAMISLVLTLHEEGLLGCVVVDSHIRTSLLKTLPRTQSIVAQASTIAPVTDTSRGVIALSTMHYMVSFAVIACFYDDSLSEVESEAMLVRSLNRKQSLPQSYFMVGTSREQVEVGPDDNVTISPVGFCQGYDGILRGVKRFGSEGYKELGELNYDNYCKTLESSSVKATLRRLEAEKKIMDDQLEHVDWHGIRNYVREKAQVREMRNVLQIMRRKENNVRRLRIRDVLRSCHPGTKLQYVRHEKNPENLSDFDNDNSSLPKEWDGTTEGPVEQTMSEDLVSIEENLHQTKTSIVPAVFLIAYDPEDTPMDVSVKHGLLVICIGLDGMWNLISSEDVINISNHDDNLYDKVSQLRIPHLSSFDYLDDSGPHGRAIAPPESEEEASDLQDIIHQAFLSKDEDDEGWLSLRLEEVLDMEENILNKVDALEENEWRDREDEIKQFRELRKEALVLAGRIKVIKKTDVDLDRELQKRKRKRDRMSKASLAVLAETNALKIAEGENMRMTPIGLFAAELHAPHPIICAAFLLLGEEIQYVSTAQFAAALSSLSTASASALRGKKKGSDVRDVDTLVDIFPRNSPDLIGFGIKLCDFLTELEKQYFLPPPLTPDSYIPDFQKSPPSPASMQILSMMQSRTNVEKYRPRQRPMIDTRCARIVYTLVSNKNMSWRQALDSIPESSNEVNEGDLISVMRVVRTIARQCSGCMQVDRAVRDKAAEIVQALSRWPIVEDEGFGFDAEEKNDEIKRSWMKWWDSVNKKFEDARNAQSFNGVERQEKVESVVESKT